MENGSFMFVDLLRRSAELNRRKAEMHVLIQLVVGSIEHEARNVPIYIDRDPIEIGGYRYTWGIGGPPKYELVLVKWYPGSDIVHGIGKHGYVWSGRDANGIPAEKVDEVYATMDHLLQQSLRYVEGFKKKLVEMAILPT